MDKGKSENPTKGTGHQAADDSSRHRPNGNFVHDHLLSILLLGMFLVSLIAQYYFQYQHEVAEASLHGDSLPGALSGDYLVSFAASVFENWQSEFLQLLSFVVLATYFIHRGSPQSGDTAREMSEDIKAIKEKLGA
jgi:hypothetical protein